MKYSLNTFLADLGLYTRLVPDEGSRLFFKFPGFFTPVPDKPGLACETVRLIPSDGLKIEISEFPSLSPGKIKKIIYYSLRSRYQDSLDKLNYFFIILSRDRKRNQCRTALFIYNKTSVSGYQERQPGITDFCFDILPYILYAKHYRTAGPALFVFQTAGNRVFLYRDREGIVSIMPGGKNKEPEKIKTEYFKDKAADILTNIRDLKAGKTDKVRYINTDPVLYEIFLKKRHEVIENKKMAGAEKQSLIFRKVLTAGSVILMALIMICLFAIKAVHDKKQSLAITIKKEEGLLAHAGKIRDEVSRMEMKKDLLAGQSTWFYYLYQLTKTAGKDLAFLNLEYSAFKQCLLLDAYADDFSRARKFIERLKELRLFNDVSLENTEQYAIRQRNFLKFRISMKIKE